MQERQIIKAIGDNPSHALSIAPLANLALGYLDENKGVNAFRFPDSLAPSYYIVPFITRLGVGTDFSQKSFRQPQTKPG